MRKAKVIRRIGFLVLVAVAVPVLLILGHSQAAALTAGLWLGVAYLMRIQPVVKGVEPIKYLVLDLRPLVLPLLVVVVAGTLSYKVWVPLLVVPIVLILGWYLIAAPEVHPTSPDDQSTWEELKRAWRWLRASGMHWRVGKAVLIVALLLLAFSLHFLIPNLTVNDDRPDFLTGVIISALTLWILAVFWRLLGYFTSWIRGLVAVLSFLVFIRLLMTAGLLPGHDWLVKQTKDSSVLSWAQSLHGLLVLLGVFLGLAVVASAGQKAKWLRWLNKDRFSTGPTDTFRALGFALAVLATLALGGAAFAGVYDFENRATVEINPGGEVILGSHVTRAPLPTDPDRLARDYLPVLAFTPHERWAPIDVNDYLHDPKCPAELVSLTAPGPPQGDHPGIATAGDACPGRFEDPNAPAGTPVPKHPDPGCPSLRIPCYRVTIRCPDGGEDCAEGHFRDDKGDSIPDYRTGAVYVRTVPVVSAAPGVVNASPFPKLTTLVQYWYFYRYDEWTRPVLSGHLVQRHEGDWEEVTIGFSPAAPLFVAYSAHCSGSWQPWGQVQLAPTDDVKRAVGNPSLAVEDPQPLVAVAEGSHANYGRTGDLQVPDWAKCAGKAPKGTTTVLSLASNIRDKTSSAGWTWEPPPTKTGIQQVEDGTFPMNLPWSWGGNDIVKLVNHRDKPLGNPGGGPSTPTLQSTWYDPVRTIFCTGWDGPDSYDSAARGACHSG